MPKFNDDISYPFKQNPVIQDSFLMTDSQNQKRTKTVKFEDVFEAIAQYFNNTNSPLSQNNVFRFVEFSVLIGSRFTTIPDETLYEQAVLDKINDAFASLNLTVLQTELIIFKVNVINYGSFNSSQRKYFLPAPLGKGVYEPLSDHITAEELEVAYIQNSSSGVTPPLVTNVPGMYVFNLGDITVHGLSIINFLNTIEVTEWPNGYDLSDENTIYFFNYELDNVEYLLFFDAEASANGNGSYGAQGDFLFSSGDLIELYDSENPQPVVVNAVPEAPNDGQTYGRKNLTWEPVSMTGIVGTINQVLLQDNEITSDTPIVYTDNGILRTIYQNGQITFIDTTSGRQMVYGPNFIQSLESGIPVNSYISLVFDTLAPGITEYMLTNEPGGVKIIASRDWVSSQIDTAVVGLLDDRGNYNASGNTFPTTGGSGTGGAVLKGDLWTISVAGTLGGVSVTVGDVVRALVDSPGQTPSNWSVTENNLGYVPENSANKATTMTGNTASNTVFLSAKAVFDWVTGLLATASTAGITKLYNALGVNTDGAITQKAVTDALDTKITQNSIQDISLTSTIVGWASFTRREINVLDLGHAFLVVFALEGLSNSASSTFTVPFVNTGGLTSNYIRITNNSTANNVPGNASIGNGSSTIILSVNNTGGVFTASGNKSTIGEILIYKTA